MGVFYETIPNSLVSWIMEQQMFWVGTAPLSGDGHINISPKGGCYYGILSPTKFWYMDLSGSGVETHAHLHEPGNGRICVMFMAFDGPPKIVRLWGTGTAHENGTPTFNAFVAEHKVEVIPGSRSVITIDIDQVASSCGFSVPYYDFRGHRPILNDHFAKKERNWKEGNEQESMDHYWALKSQLSIDGLPGMKRGYEFAKKEGIAPLKKMVGKAGEKVGKGRVGPVGERIGIVHLLLVLLLGMVIGGAMSLSVVSPERLVALRRGQGFL